MKGQCPDWQGSRRCTRILLCVSVCVCVCVCCLQSLNFGTKLSTCKVAHCCSGVQYLPSSFSNEQFVASAIMSRSDLCTKDCTLTGMAVMGRVTNNTTCNVPSAEQPSLQHHVTNEVGEICSSCHHSAFGLVTVIAYHTMHIQTHGVVNSQTMLCCALAGK